MNLDRYQIVNMNVGDTINISHEMHIVRIPGGYIYYKQILSDENHLIEEIATFVPWSEVAKDTAN